MNITTIHTTEKILSVLCKGRDQFGFTLEASFTPGLDDDAASNALAEALPWLGMPEHLTLLLCHPVYVFFNTLDEAQETQRLIPHEATAGLSLRTQYIKDPQGYTPNVS